MLADINGNLADLRSEAAMASQRFCLRWNNHQSNLLSVFDQLLHDESFVDVTLAVEGQLLRAHKMVLSACSPYFQALFVGHPDKHPIVILKDVPYADMRSLLDFMYRGEVSVDQDRLTAFLRVAESLRIKGLTEVNEDKSDLPSITSSLLGNQNTVPPPPPNLHRINQLGQHHHMPQKRYHHMSSHPLLGSALTAPKRKRGRPRKLSGSSDTPMDSNLGQEQCGSDLVQGSPEMMEMKMGLDFQSEVAQNSSAGSSSASTGSNNNATTPSKKDEPMENGTETETPLLVRIKGEPEPTPSTSAQAKEEAFTRPLSRQGSESFKQDGEDTTSSCGAGDGQSPNSGNGSHIRINFEKCFRKEYNSIQSNKNENDTSVDMTDNEQPLNAKTPKQQQQDNLSSAIYNLVAGSESEISQPEFESSYKSSTGTGTAGQQQQQQQQQTTAASAQGATNNETERTEGNLPNLPSDITFEICSTVPETNHHNHHRHYHHNNDYNDDFEPDPEDDNSNSNSTSNPCESEHQQSSINNINSTVINRIIINDDATTKNSSSPSSLNDNNTTNYLRDDERAELLLRTCKQDEDNSSNVVALTTGNNGITEPEPEVRKQLLEYLIQKDGSVVCKWCGEVLPSRTRWYRHKYKLHVTTQVTQPAPLFKCHSCNAYFKSRKGYIGHLSSRHSDDNENDENREVEPSALNKTTIANHQLKSTGRKTNDIGKCPDWEQQREKEEKLVADIIDRVKRECEAQGETVSRRGYSRRSTVMNS